ncbi:type VII secretion integral membrane protein EccD [Actinoallomurus liliacearum]|uniref:type VII secretion integral membrane protein EccD n=1 Tax=Actinoallomurus liliacearum TaxID=1080073 RepID=UPI0031E72B0C
MSSPAREEARSRVSPTAGADLCRVTVVGPSRRLDISLPADVPFAELFPTILRHAGDDLANVGLGHGGWVLQRLDEPPLDPSATPNQAGLRDGQVVYLRPGMSQLPEMAFDDVADVVATGVNEKPDRWRPEHARRVGIGVGAAALTVGSVLPLFSGPPWIVPAITAGAVGLLLLVAGVTLSRAMGDGVAGSVIGLVALPYAFVAGLLGPMKKTTPPWDFGAPHLVAGFAAVVLVAVIAAFAIADGVPTFLGAAFAALMGTIGTTVALFYDGVSAGGVAAVTVAVTLALTPLIPTLAFRMARVTLPPVPTSADDLRRDTLMVDGQAVLGRTRRADRFVTGMAVGIALVGLVGEFALAFTDGWAAPVACAVTSLTLLLRSRIFRGRAQRLWFLLSGFAGLVMLAVGQSLHATGQVSRVVVLISLVVGALVVVAVGGWLPENRPSPFWARAGDIVEILLIVALIALAPGVLGLYDYIRDLAG